MSCDSVPGAVPPPKLRSFSATSLNLVTFNAMIHACESSWPLALELFTELGDLGPGKGPGATRKRGDFDMLEMNICGDFKAVHPEI